MLVVRRFAFLTKFEEPFGEMHVIDIGGHVIAAGSDRFVRMGTQSHDALF